MLNSVFCSLVSVIKKTRQCIKDVMGQSPDNMVQKTSVSRGEPLLLYPPVLPQRHTHMHTLVDLIQLQTVND